MTETRTENREEGLLRAIGPVGLTASVINEALFSVIVVVMVLVSVLPAPLFKRSLAVVADERREAQALGSDGP